jgi:hypothetical protein
VSIAEDAGLSVQVYIDIDSVTFYSKSVPETDLVGTISIIQVPKLLGDTSIETVTATATENLKINTSVVVIYSGGIYSIKKITPMEIAEESYKNIPNY